jgi:hypothetical protein
MVQLEHKVGSKELKEPQVLKVPQELKVLSRQHRVLKVLQVSKEVQVLQDQFRIPLERQVELDRRVMLGELDLQVLPQELRVLQDLVDSQEPADLMEDQDLKVLREDKDSKGFSEKHRVLKDRKGVLDKPEQRVVPKELRVLVVRAD